MGRRRIYATAAERQKAYRGRIKERSARQVYEAVLLAAVQGFPAARQIVEGARQDINLGRGADPPPFEAVMVYLKLHFLAEAHRYHRLGRL